MHYVKYKKAMFIFSKFFILLLLVLYVSPAFTDEAEKLKGRKVYVNIGSPEFKKPMIAVHSRCSGPACPDMQYVEDVIKSDMLRSNAFVLLPEKVEPEEEKRNNLLAWKVTGTDYLIVLDFIRTHIRVRLIVMTTGEEVLDQRVRLQRSYIDTAHDISDVVYTRLTNEPSVFKSKIAMMCGTDDDRNKNLFVMDYDGRRMRRLTSNDDISISPAWSPDGKYIAYTRYERKYYRGKGSLVNQAIYLYDLSSGRETLLIDGLGQNSGVAWSPDSKSIAFTMSRGSHPNIYMMDINNKKPRPLVQNIGLDVEPNFSPDGKYLVYSSTRSGNPELYTLEIENRKQTRLTFTRRYNSSPSWSPLGDMIAFAGLDNPFGAGHASRFDIFMVNPQGTRIERMTIDSGNNENPSWAPNGRHLVYSSTRNRGSDIYTIHSDGTGEDRLTRGIRCYSPAWSPIETALK